jgi:beta-glucosidase
MNRLLKFSIISFLIYSVLILWLNYSFPKTKWDWTKLNTSELNFPKNFLWGTATAAHQVEGSHTNSNWSWWETQKDENNKPRIDNNEKAGIAVDHWNLYPQDIQLMKELGTNSYRFSLSWSKIMPKPHVFDYSALQHYSNVIDSLIANGIEPMITLHHFEEPLWFTQKGGFEKEENIAYFLEFSKKVLEMYQSRVHYWATFNEENVYVNSGYFSGIFPPGKKDAKLAGNVLLNILKAHVQTYQMAKQLPNSKFTKIGIVMSLFLFEPENRLNVLDWLATYFANDNFNGTILRFFKTGTYRYIVLPFGGIVSYTDMKAPHCLDFFGVNYYSHFAVQMNITDPQKAVQPVKGEVITDMKIYTVFPEGIYEAIKMASELNVPIIITENGIGDSKDKYRGEFIKRSLYAISKAINDKYDVRGYYYWSLMDNFEWNLGYTQKFGLYEVDLKTQVRKLRDGSKEYQKIVLKFN